MPDSEDAAGDAGVGLAGGWRGFGFDTEKCQGLCAHDFVHEVLGVAVGGGVAGGERGAEAGGSDGVVGVEGGAKDDVPEFGVVAGPGVFEEHAAGFRGERAHAFAEFDVCFVEEAVGDGDDVFGSAAEWGDGKGVFGEQGMEVGVEEAEAHELIEVAAGGGDEADGEGLARGHAGEAAGAERFEEAGLHVVGEFVHVFEDEGAAFGRAEMAQGRGEGGVVIGGGLGRGDEVAGCEGVAVKGCRVQVRRREGRGR